MSKVALISCVSIKAEQSCPDKDLYISPLFQKSYQFAVKTGCNHIFILSAKYGIIPDNQVIAPYDLTLNNMTKQQRILWSNKVNIDINKLIVPGTQILLLAGVKYSEFLDLSNFKVYNPMRALPIGKRLQYLTSRI